MQVGGRSEFGVWVAEAYLICIKSCWLVSSNLSCFGKTYLAKFHDSTMFVNEVSLGHFCMVQNLMEYVVQVEVT